MKIKINRKIAAIVIVLILLITNIFCLSACDMINGSKENDVVTSDYYVEPNLVTHIDNGILKYEALLPKISSKEDVTFAEYVTSTITNEARTYLENYTKEATKLYEDYKTSIEQKFEEERESQLKQLKEEYKILFVDLESLVDDTKENKDAKETKIEETKVDGNIEETVKEETVESQTETQVETQAETIDDTNATEETVSETEEVIVEADDEIADDTDNGEERETYQKNDEIEGFANTKKPTKNKWELKNIEDEYGLFEDKQRDVTVTSLQEMTYYSDITEKDVINEEKYKQLQNDYKTQYDTIINNYNEDKLEEELKKYEPVSVGSKYIVKNITNKFISIYVEEYIDTEEKNNRVQTYNLDLVNKKIMNISEYLGEGYKDKIITSIKTEIENWSEEEKTKLLNQDLTYIDDLVNENTMFYLNNKNELFVCFNKYDILVGSAGLAEFEIK